MRYPNAVANDFPAAPEVVFEIASPNQSTNALVRRCLWSVEHGVHSALLVDPMDRSVVQFKAGAQPRVLRGEDAVSIGEVVPDFALSGLVHCGA